MRSIVKASGAGRRCYCKRDILVSDMNVAALGRRLTALRREAGLTQAELAQANEVLMRLERFWAGSLGYAWRVSGPASDAA